MSWTGYLVLALAGAYFLFLVVLYFIKKSRGEPIDPCEHAKGPKLVEDYHKMKRRQARLTRRKQKQEAEY